MTVKELQAKIQVLEERIRQLETRPPLQYHFHSHPPPYPWIVWPIATTCMYCGFALVNGCCTNQYCPGKNVCAPLPIPWSCAIGYITADSKLQYHNF